VKNVEVKFKDLQAICTIEKASAFDADKAIVALDAEGFEKSTVAK
jgi:hypothetical protein